MRQAPGEAVQKLCPSCSTLSYTDAKRCPWRGAGFRRRLWPGLAALLLIQALLVLGGVAAMFEIASEVAQSRFDTRVDRVERDIDASFDDVERAVREELDRRLPEEQAAP
jgi:hypothetical protein